MQEIPVDSKKTTFFICTRTRDNVDKPGCGVVISTDDVKSLKLLVKEKGLKNKISLIPTGCQSFCPYKQAIISSIKPNMNQNLDFNIYSCKSLDEIRELIFSKELKNG